MSLFSCVAEYKGDIRIERGILEMPKEWDGTAVSLEGEWLSLPGIREYEDFLDHYDETSILTIPSRGALYSDSGMEKAQTIFLHVELPHYFPEYEMVSILTRKIRTAHRVFVNGHLVMENGTVGFNEATHVPRVKPKMGNFPYTKSFDLVIQVSNFSFPGQGILEAPIFGKSQSVFSHFYATKFYDIILIIVIALFMLINIGIYFSHTKDKSSLIYSILLLLILGYIPFSGTGDRLIWDLFPGLSYHSIIRFSGLTIFFGVPIYLWFLRVNFSREFHPDLFRAYLLIKLPSVLVAYLYSPSYFPILFTMIGFDVIVVFLSYQILFLAIQRKRPQAKLLLFGFVVFGLTAIHECLMELGYVELKRSSLYGVLILFFSHSSALVYRLRKTYKDNADLAIGLKRSKEFLEIRVKERTRALLDAMDRVKDANKLKDRFLSIVSHDIRSPLSSVSSLMEIILQEEDMELEEVHDILQSSKKSIDSLILMTSEILNYAKNQNARILPKFEILSLEKIINTTLNKLYSLIREKNLHLVIEGDTSIEIQADPSLIGIALTNFLSNAIKFTEHGGRILIEYYNEGDYCQLKITDSGVGIAPENIKNIFSYELNQSTTGTQGEKGTGFGLPFSKEILDAMKAELSIQSEVSKGTTIAILFIKNKKNLLILDNNHNSRAKLRNSIESMSRDFFIIEKESGESALEQLDLLDFHSVITDHFMPGMNGVDFAYRIRDSYPNKKIKIVLLTTAMREGSEAKVEIERIAKSVGIDMVLSRDPTKKELLNLLQQLDI
jgi:signal transduction histidine kinase/CheY-like chemotaxis protein